MFVRFDEGMRLVELMLIMILRSIYSTVAATPRLNLPSSLPSNCTRQCGDIKIEYPFGIGDGCFRSDGFNLTCQNSPPRLLLGDGTIEVRKIDMDQGVVYIESPDVTLDVDAQNISAKLFDLKNWPLSFNLKIVLSDSAWKLLAHNKFYVIGCSATANLVDTITNKSVNSCSTKCYTNASSIHAWNFGNGYCTLYWDGSIDERSSSIGIQLTRLDGTDSHLINTSSIKVIMNDTGYDVNTEEVVQEIMKGNKTGWMASLGWYISDHPTCKEANKNGETYACLSQNSDCYDVSPGWSNINYTIGYFCGCSASYHGNPYLVDGCQDTTFQLSPQKDYCAKKCGSTEIPYPFGLKQGCYRDESFLLQCNQTSNPPTLKFGGNFVRKILLDKGQLELEYPLQGDYYEYAYRERPFIFAEENLIMNWVIEHQHCEEAIRNGSRYACVAAQSSCHNKSLGPRHDYFGYLCECVGGYKGNPYIQNGCQDINECKSPASYGCTGICTNTEGGFSCTCPPGTFNDTKHGGCIPDKKTTLLLGVIVGTSSGVGLLFFTIMLVIISRKWKKRKQQKIREKHFHQNHGLLLQKLISSSENVVERMQIFSLEEIVKATNNFDETRILGRGGHGTVYKGILLDQRVVAIKRSKNVKKCEIDQFLNEVAILSQINHRHVVKLFGCCLETEVPLLVYEFISKGALSEHLHKLNDHSTLSWNDRLRIATEAAGALAYLHSSASISIFHRDVKSSNILLDDNFTAKVSDFGASRCIPLDQTHLVTAVQGTFGYLDPEYYQTSQLTEKSDVYSFGVILLELITGKKPVYSTENEKDLNLAMHFLQARRHNQIFDLMEDCIMKEATKEELDEIIQLIEMCIRLKGVERPTMKEVEYKLQVLRRTRIKKNKGLCIVEDNEETGYLLSASSYASGKGTSRNYSMEKELMVSQYYGR
ncbi:wall-associated receptor kinase 3-like [Canna indica]|uniref:Wall-associated receptor kinase 3-like n=1 Tax=Canna indica TaxID=4628 RepID=A0AAQ3K0I7_9LILI|nr:wall-associated receptor kinase 3-like [Canna indica]